MLRDTLIYDLPIQQEGYGAFDNQDDVENLSPWCFLCGVGEDHRNIKVCLECRDYFDDKIL